MMPSPSLDAQMSPLDLPDSCSSPASSAPPSDSQSKSPLRTCPGATPTLVHHDNVSNMRKKRFRAAVYDSEAPTKSYQLEMNALTTITDFIDFIVKRCTARLKLQDIQSSCIFYSARKLYVDHRFDSFDYEKPLSSYLAQNGHPPTLIDLGKDTALAVENMNVELGKPYVLVHDGDCEHIVIFDHVCADKCKGNCSYDQHTENNEELDDVMNFAFGSSPQVTPEHHNIETQLNQPRETWRRPIRVFCCDVCKARMATKFTVVDPLADKAPFHYCRLCFSDAHYTRDGRLLPSSQTLKVYDHQH